MTGRTAVCCLCDRECMFVCICRNPPLPLCGTCIRTHQVQHEGVHGLFRRERIEAMHDNWHEHARRLLQRIKTAESCLQHSELQVLECRVFLDQKCSLFNESKNYISLRSLIHSEFIAFKSSVEAGILDMKRNLLNPTFNPGNDLSLQIYQYKGKPTSCFEWWKTENSVKFMVEYPKNTEVKADEKAKSRIEHCGQGGVDLVHVQSWWKYDQLQGTFGAVRLVGSGQPKWPLTISLSDGGLCCIGDCHYSGASTSAFLVSSAGECRAISPLLTARGSPGAVALHRFVYVLGGVSLAGVLQSCSERLSLDSTPPAWEPIPALTAARRSFTPCAYEDAVYICGGWGTRKCEVLDTCSLKYTPLPLELQEESDVLSACVGGGEILIVTRSHFVMWDAKLNSTIYSQSHEPLTCIYSSSGAVVLERKIYFAGFGNITVIGFDSGEIQRIWLESIEDK